MTKFWPFEGKMALSFIEDEKGRRMVTNHASPLWVNMVSLSIQVRWVVWGEIGGGHEWRRKEDFQNAWLNGGRSIGPWLNSRWVSWFDGQELHLACDRGFLAIRWEAFLGQRLRILSWPLAERLLGHRPRRPSWPNGPMFVGLFRHSLSTFHVEMACWWVPLGFADANTCNR